MVCAKAGASMKLFEHPDFEQAIIRAAEHFQATGGAQRSSRKTTLPLRLCMQERAVDDQIYTWYSDLVLAGRSAQMDAYRGDRFFNFVFRRIDNRHATPPSVDKIPCRSNKILVATCQAPPLD